MKKTFMRKTRNAIVGVLLAAMTVSLVACGSEKTTDKSQNNEPKQEASSNPKTEVAESVSADSPYAGMGYDLSEQRDIVMYVIGDEPADMDMVLEKVNNDYLIPNLNSTLDVKFLNWSDYGTKYSLVLAGGEQVDLMYTSAWCYYNEEAGRGAFKKLDMDFIQKYMPYTYEMQPSESWDQISIDGTIYAVPRSKSKFPTRIVVARQDLIEKYSLTKPDSWDNYKTYLNELAALKKETGVVPLNTNANREMLMEIYMQTKTIEQLASGFDWYYASNNKEDVPAISDISYLYTSDFYKEYVLEMAELAQAGAWNSDAINDTADAQAYWENGTSGSFVWNSTVFKAGATLESNGLGTYDAYDISPESARRRSTYANDAFAITSNSIDAERAALVLDYLKTDVNLNRLILGGIEGYHWELNSEGQRVSLDAAANYSWNGWAWALNRADEPEEAGIDSRWLKYNEDNAAMEYHPVTAGFTFDVTPVETTYTVIKSIVDEYEMSFHLGVFGEDTENTLSDFQDAIKKAGLDELQVELEKQYQEFLDKKGFK